MNHEVSNLNAVEAAEFLGLSVQTLANWRHRRTGPPYIKIGGRIVYRWPDLNEFLEKYRIDPESNQLSNKTHLHDKSRR